MGTEWTVISLGGSIIVPDEIDTTFLIGFAELIRRHVAEGKKFIIIAGGGKTVRRYQAAARDVTSHTPGCVVSSEDLDWLGIHGTRLNGHLIRTIFCDIAHPALVKDPTLPLPDAMLIVAAGWKPGWSTDYDAVLLAKNAGAKKLVNLSNIEYVYTADPKKDPSATKIEKINWPEFRKLLPEKWDPGLSVPFDPVAAKEAEGASLEVAVIRGTSLPDLDNYLSDKPFKGTLISD
ncbi:MAG: UMP kinase [Patescibacteria group bacterium]